MNSNSSLCHSILRFNVRKMISATASVRWHKVCITLRYRGTDFEEKTCVTEIPSGIYEIKGLLYSSVDWCYRLS
ncbi:6945_t:CDS:2 [Rhizophagus irregularis]|nr:6945_t:CDS:2 [Rhizophagus irregularis]